MNNGLDIVLCSLPTSLSPIVGEAVCETNYIVGIINRYVHVRSTSGSCLYYATSLHAIDLMWCNCPLQKLLQFFFIMHT